MAIVDGNDLLRKAHLKQDEVAGGSKTGSAQTRSPAVPTVEELIKEMDSMPRYTPGKSAAADLWPDTAWTDIPVEDYSSYLEQMHEAKRQAAVAGLEAAYQQNMAQLERSGERTKAEYQAARNQTAGASELAKHNFNQYAAASGLNSGAGGQAELARSVALQGSLGDINAREANAMAELELKRAEAETEYNTAIAQARYTGEYELAAALYEEKVRVQEALTEQEMRRQQNALEQYQLKYQAQRDAVEDKRYEYEQELDAHKYQNSLALQQAAQLLKEKEQADEIQLAQQKQKDALSEARRKMLAQYGELFMLEGVLPTDSMCLAMGITPDNARRFILMTKEAKK